MSAAAPDTCCGRRRKARTPSRASKLLAGAGFTAATWHDLYAFIIKAATATV